MEIKINSLLAWEPNIPHAATKLVVVQINEPIGNVPRIILTRDETGRTYTNTEDAIAAHCTTIADNSADAYMWALDWLERHQPGAALNSMREDGYDGTVDWGGLYRGWAIEHKQQAKPAPSLPKMHATVIIIPAHGRYLMVWHNKLNGWRHPGGKIELGESNFTAAKRELKEELGLMTCNNDLDFVGHFPHTVGDQPCIGHYFVLNTLRSFPSLMEPSKSYGIMWRTVNEIDDPLENQVISVAFEKKLIRNLAAMKQLEF